MPLLNVYFSTVTLIELCVRMMDCDEEKNRGYREEKIPKNAIAPKEG